MRGIFAHVERIVETVIPQLGNAVVGQLCIRQQRRDDPVRLHIAAQARDLLAECAVRMAPVIVELLFRNVLPARDRREYLRSEEHTSELQSLMRSSYAVFW